MRPIPKKLTALGFTAALAFGGVACDDDDGGDVGDEVEEGVNEVEEGVNDVEEEVDGGGE